MPSAVSSRGTLALLFGQRALMAVVTGLILVGGVWGSWGTAQYVMLTKGRERGTVVVTDCSQDACTGPYRPVSAGSVARPRVRLDTSVGVRTGEVLTVVVKPGTDEVVRSGPAGVLYAWLPLGGALVLAGVVVAGGLRLRRTAWVMGGSGLALVTAAFVALH
ncbi:hypothetical protein [Streptomyces griseoaurantiacus]|uniref:Uncharacterized protein n=1 Tax=Streptomyces griseoaurantiacus TaxID=68213 RepID=A0A7W2HYE4_9ACTN|nr:hypothetical protein [Streptomyces griseoaurantiacus]MBA5226148.1 hypothetical protein [Streptomyces griseoaurantiacus]